MSATHSIIQLSEGASRIFLTPLQEFLDDRSVTEIMVNGPNDIFIERGGEVTRVARSFKDHDTLVAAANIICQFVGKHLTEESPRVDARLPDGSRVHIIGPPVALNGVCLSIRRFPERPLNAEDLLRFGAVNELALELLRLCVAMHLNLIVSGGTGSGKTSMLNVLGGCVDQRERIILIEDTAELQINRDHVVRLEARPPDDKGRSGVTIRELFHSTLRMRPDRIIVGEVRGKEALDLVQAMTSGHAGSLSTVHATTPRDALHRLETLCLYADSGLPLHAIRSQVSSAMHIVVQTARLRDGSRKITEITEVEPISADGSYQVRPLFAFEIDYVDQDGHIVGALKCSGNEPSFLDEACRQGFPLSEELLTAFRQGG